MTLVGTNTESRLVAALESVIETTQDFTDSAYTTHDHRQHILMICEQLRHQLSVVLRIGASMVRTRRFCLTLMTHAWQVRIHTVDTFLILELIFV